MTYHLAATANTKSEDLEEQVRIDMCRNVIDEINLLIKDFKTKAYRDSLPSFSDEDNQSSPARASEEGEQNEFDEEEE